MELTGRWYRLAVLVVVLLGIVVRVVGISREPVWLDEAWSAEFSSGSVSEILLVNARDNHPPLYYLVLKHWMSICGRSPACLRSLSTLWSALGILVVILFARDLTGDRRASLLAGTLLAINPHDIVSAQEARMFSEVASLGLMSSWSMWRLVAARKKTVEAGDGETSRWFAVYVIVSSLALYTHYMVVFLLLAQVSVVALVALGRRDLNALRVTVTAAIAPTALLLPWVFYVQHVVPRMVSEENLSWVPHPSVTEAVSYLWRDYFLPFGLASRALSTTVAWSSCLLVLGATTLLVHEAATNSQRRLPILYLFWLLIVPAAVAYLVSQIVLPVYFRPRFATMLLPYFVLLLVFAMREIKPRAARRTVAAAAVSLMIASGAAQYQAVTRSGMADFASLYASSKPDLVSMFPSHYTILASYYLQQSIRNPSRNEIERKRRNGLTFRIWVCSTPGFEAHGSSPQRELRDWLLTLGRSRFIASVDGLNIVEIDVKPHYQGMPVLELGQRVDCGDELADSYLQDGWYPAEGGFRWSKGERARIAFRFNDTGVPHAATLKFGMMCFREQRVSLELNGVEIGSFTCSKRTSHLREFEIAPGVLQLENTLDITLPDATAPSDVSDSRDSRRIALACEWFGIQ